MNKFKDFELILGEPWQRTYMGLKYHMQEAYIEKNLNPDEATYCPKYALFSHKYYNEIRPTSPGNNMNYSIYDAYSFYCKQNNSQNVSKSYFEKYIFDNFNQYIVDSKFLSCEWYML